MTAPSTTTRDFVLAVHGFAGKRLWMLPLCRFLRSQDFDVAAWGYLSVNGSIEKHATRLHRHLKDSLSHKTRLHIVAHSMGSIVVRSALSMGPIPNLCRVVFFAPPNTGTPVARVAGRLLGRICKPIAELSDREHSFVNMLGTLKELDVAVIAGRYDFLVPTANTHLPGEREHVVLNATHNSLLFSPTAARLTASFLSTGKFPKDRETNR